MAQKSNEKPETRFALALAWIVSPCVLSLLGFYFGTIFANREHKIDLQAADIHVGRQYAFVFFCISIVAAVITTIVIPKVVEKDYATREANWASRANDPH